MLYLAKNRIIVGAPTSYTNGATATVTIDRAGGGNWVGQLADELQIVANFTTTSAATNVPTVMKLQESDVTNATTFVDIAGSTLTSAVTTMNTSGTNVVEWTVSNNGARKRYINVVISPVTTQIIAVQANLGRARIEPFTASDKNILATLAL